MNRRKNRMITATLILVSAIISAAVVFPVFRGSDKKNDGEYGMMKLFSPENTEEETRPSSGQETEIQEDSEMDKENDIPDWFKGYEMLFECAMSEAEKKTSFSNDTEFLSRCIADCADRTGIEVPIPSSDLTVYKDSLEDVSMKNALLGDIVFSCEENGNVRQAGIKGYRNVVYFLEDGRVVRRYLSDMNGNISFARIFPEGSSTEEMEEERERTGCLDAALTGDVDLSLLGHMSKPIRNALNNAYGEWGGMERCQEFWITQITEDTEKGILQLTVVPDCSLDEIWVYASPSTGEVQVLP